MLLLLVVVWKLWKQFPFGEGDSMQSKRVPFFRVSLLQELIVVVVNSFLRHTLFVFSSPLDTGGGGGGGGGTFLLTIQASWPAQANPLILPHCGSVGSLYRPHRRSSSRPLFCSCIPPLLQLYSAVDTISLLSSSSRPPQIP